MIICDHFRIFNAVDLDADELATMSTLLFFLLFLFSCIYCYVCHLICVDCLSLWKFFDRGCVHNTCRLRNRNYAFLDLLLYVDIVYCCQGKCLVYFINTHSIHMCRLSAHIVLISVIICDYFRIFKTLSIGMRINTQTHWWSHGRNCGAGGNVDYLDSLMNSRRMPHTYTHTHTQSHTSAVFSAGPDDLLKHRNTIQPKIVKLNSPLLQPLTLINSRQNVWMLVDHFEGTKQVRYHHYIITKYHSIFYYIITNYRS